MVIVAARKRPSGPARSGAHRGEGRRSVPASQAYNGAIRSQLEELQRARIVNATFDVAAERGAANTSVAHLVERAGVARRTFYEIFTDRQAAAAPREFDRPAPASQAKPQAEAQLSDTFKDVRPSAPPKMAERQAEAQLSDTFKDAGVRLTYRTVRVLTAIGENPDASNRLIADTSEINDPGQISKLLSSLERVGMISNTKATPGKGAPNSSWTLSARGAQVVETIRAHTEGRRREGHER